MMDFLTVQKIRVLERWLQKYREDGPVFGLVPPALAARRHAEKLARNEAQIQSLYAQEGSA